MTIYETPCSCGCGGTVRYKPLPPSQLKLRGPKRFLPGHQNRGHKPTAEHVAKTRKPMEKNGRWKGGRFVNPQGYVFIKNWDHPFHNKAGYVQEHRLVMEQVLGRYLERTELVHHINRIRDDNRPENLKVLSHVEHQRLERIGNHYPRPTTLRFVCERCGKEYYKQPSHTKWFPRSRFCSWECRYPKK